MYKKFKIVSNVNFMVKSCISDIQHCIVQLMHTRLKKSRIIKTFLK